MADLLEVRTPRRLCDLAADVVRPLRKRGRGMSPYVYAGAFLCAVAIGFHVPSWVAARRTTRRYDAASLAFWTSLTAYVDRAYDDIDNDTAARFDARIEAALMEGTASPIGDATAAPIAAQAAESIDAEWRELA